MTRAPPPPHTTHAHLPPFQGIQRVIIYDLKNKFIAFMFNLRPSDRVEHVVRRREAETETKTDIERDRDKVKKGRREAERGRKGEMPHAAYVVTTNTLTPLLFVSPLVLSPPIPPFLRQVCEWNSVFILTSSNKIYHLVEKDTQSKVRGACAVIYISNINNRVIFSV